MKTYSTRDGDMIDSVCAKHYGACNDEVLRIVYAANPGIVEAGLLLQAGVTITLPDITRAQFAPETAVVKLWD